MMQKSHKISDLVFKRYPGKLALVFLLNLCSVVLTIFVFVMIEPFCKLLFRGSIDNLSPISDFILSLLKPLIDIQNVNVSIVILLLFALALYFLKNLFAYASQWVMASMRSDLLYKLRNDLYRKILILPIGYFSNQKRGDVVSRAVADTQEVQNTVLNSIRSFLTEPISVVLFVAFLFYINTRLSLYAILIFPVTFLIIGRISNVLKRDVRTSKKRLGSLLAHVEETIAGVRVVKGLNAQATSEDAFRKLNDQFTKSQTIIYRRADLASPLSEFLGVTIVMVILVIGGSMTFRSPELFPAELFITYIALFTQLITPLKNISTAIAGYKRGVAALDRINEIMDADEVIKQPNHPVAVSEFSDRISFNHVDFSYTNVPVLSDFNLVIEKGKMVALVGQSGSGKTTIMDLVERFYDPAGGAITLDGVDIRNYDIPSYRALFSLVSQDVVLFNDTLYNNITMGFDASEEEVYEALRIANLEEFVATLPDGLQYALSDRGLNLSGGQRQRISIARAVLRNTPILLLDEATSAMDTRSERAVQKALDNVMKNRTVIVVAHRLSTIQHADTIVVLDNGKIVEQGKHEELLSMNGEYQKLVNIQQFN